MSRDQNILIVDDTVENLVILERVLRRLPVRIIKASSGEDALKAALNNKIALALLDVQMPGMDGYELANLLRDQEEFANLPIIFISAVFSDEEHIFKGYESGAVDFIVKPFNPAHLLAKVQVFLDLNEMTLELENKVRELQASENRFQTLVRTIPDIVYRINPQGEFIFVNKAVSILGYVPEELLGKHFSTIIHPDDVMNVSRDLVLERMKRDSLPGIPSPKLFDERRNGNRATYELELRLVGRQQAAREEIFVEVSSSGIHHYTFKGKHLSFLGSVGVIRDISARKRTEDELNNYRENLELLVEERTRKLEIETKEHYESDQERQRLEAMLMQQQRLESIGTLAGGVAHEINNPINGIMNYAQLIVDMVDDEEGTEFARAIIEETERVAKIVRNLLQFARADNKSIMEQAPPSEMINYVVTLVKTIMRHDQITLVIDDDHGDLPEISCQRNEIEQVLMNLMTNACDALNSRYPGYDENKVIHVSAEEGVLDGKPSVVFCIEDHGTGITENALQHIFEPFFTTKDRTKGTGLGLSISHGIVKKHHGELRVKTELGNYTRFLLELPVEQG